MALDPDRRPRNHLLGTRDFRPVRPGQPEGPTGWNGGKVGSAAGITFSAPSIADRGGGEVDFAFVGVQNSLWYYAQTGYGPVEPSQVSSYNTAYG